MHNSRARAGLKVKRKAATPTETGVHGDALCFMVRTWTRHTTAETGLNNGRRLHPVIVPRQPRGRVMAAMFIRRNVVWSRGKQTISRRRAPCVKQQPHVLVSTDHPPPSRSPTPGGIKFICDPRCIWNPSLEEFGSPSDSACHECSSPELCPACLTSTTRMARLPRGIIGAMSVCSGTK